MRKFIALTLAGIALVAAPLVVAQPPDQRREGGPGEPATDNLVDRMMVFDAGKDSQLTKTEVTDERLHRLFDEADSDKDGTVTKSELNVLLVNERAKRSTHRGGSSRS
jgi:hypothetical protein